MKALSTLRKYLRWLIWPGLALTTAGLVAGFVDAWTIFPILLLVIGLVLALVGLIFGGFGYRSFWQSRSTQAGTNAVLATLSVLLILAAANFLAVRYAPRVDLTEAGLFTLAPESQSVVKNLQQPVEVVVFDSSLNPNDKQLLDSYRKFNDRLTYEHINPFQDPDAAREFEVSGEGREVHLEVGEDTFFVQTLGVQGLNEQDLTNKLAQLGRDRDAVIYFLQGHEEFVIDGSALGYSQAAAALEADNFTVELLRLDQTGSVPRDADAIVVAGPKQAFFEPEVDALRAYLDQGGSILLLIDPQTEPNLDPLLNDWGIDLDDRLIVDASDTGQIVGLGPTVPLVTTYGDHPITANFNNGRSFYPFARPVLLDPLDNVEATPLLLSNPQSYAETISDAGQLNIDTQQPPEGPFNIGVVLTKDVETPDNTNAEESSSQQQTDGQQNSSSDPATGETDATASNETDISETNIESSDTAAEPESLEESAVEASEEARLIVIGNATFAADSFFEQQLNGDVFLNSVTWLSNLDDTILSVRPKEITNRRIVMTVSQQAVVIALALLVFPLVGLFGASITWFRRR
ncbi:MAG: ABC transporter [Symploca sp. SIO2G7]|nr:ABC transporter [Symploca sp. SIO2G7]